ncbi:hypothetical protein FSARC_11330 [Fusarium sarcochroum]|uniref:NACHT domain-containing protein n=1 Tax=Fusarium sarcochroum TaxID=1208366 RepID=A0A8H4TG22_9HYPO|nr:hypothetical protein FSARC_11330 [Fusarium sarcochroum]
MAQRTIQIACDRFRREISSDDARLIEATTSLDDVKLAISQVERQLAARQLLRDMDRIAPFLDAIERYSKALEVAANGTPYLPWIWAPIKFVLLAVQDHTHALDKILSAYGKIGLQMPRFSRFAEAFHEDRSFQHLIGFLFEDVLEFHRRAYSMIRKPGWKMLFKSAWGGFDHRFESLLESIRRISDQIDREAVSIDLVQAVNQRKKDAEASTQRETRWRTQQLCNVLNWLEGSDTDQETKLEFLRDRCHEGTLDWVTSSPKLRGWLQRGHGKQVLWLYGKPGSGKSVLTAKLISFLRADSTRRVAFFFCDFNTPVHAASTGIFRALTAQVLRFSSDAAPFIYEEYMANGKKPTTDILKKLLPRLIANISDIRLIVDGLDEIPTSEHRKLITDLLRITREVPECRMLLISQDVPSISVQLSKYTQLSMAEEGANTRKDLTVVVSEFLRDLNSQHDDALGETVLQGLQYDILKKAEGMFLWVHLVLDILINAACLEDLRLQISSLPATLAEAFLEEHETPFINRLESQASIAYACVCQLNRGLELLAPSSTSLPVTEIALGLLSLWPYSFEHWIEHLLDCFEVEGNAMPEYILTLVERVNLACQRMMTIMMPDARQAFEDSAPLATTRKDKRLSNLLERMDPSVAHLMVELHNLSSATNDDQSPLARAMRTYQDIVEFLLREPDVEEVSHENILTFKELHGPIAFLCNVRGCEHAIIGFPSREKLKDHQALHFDKLKCHDANCSYNDVGFQTEKSLKEHRKRYHGAARLEPIPKRLRRVGKLSRDDEHNRASNEHDWDYVVNPRAPAKLSVNFCRQIKTTGVAFCASFSTDGKRVAVCGNKFASVYEIHTGTLLREFPHGSDQEDMFVQDVCFSPDGNHLATCSEDTLVRIWNIESGEKVVLSGDETNAFSVRFTPDGDTLVSGGGNCTLQFWNARTGSAIVSKDLPESIISIAISADGKHIAVGCLDGRICIFRIESKSLVTALEDQHAHKASINSIAFSPDGKQFATGSFDKTIKIWNLGQPLKCLKTLEGHEGWVFSLAFTSDARWIVSGSEDKKVRFWDTQTREYQVILEGHQRTVMSVAASPEGDCIATVSGDMVGIWSYQEL